MAVLFDFLLRLAFGLAVSMAVTSPVQVTAGYYRNHSYVLLGLFVLAFLVAWGLDPPGGYGWALAGGMLSYASAVAWLAERSRAGILLLGLTAGVALGGACPSLQGGEPVWPLGAAILQGLAPAAAGLLLGSTLA
ncbi:MAG: hypothetical protein GTO03_04935, partial [Planctomycetales bacterium]|nr:hypothetical protein [Planctomycetales bacterium]